jgi:hypothetical protein
MKVFQKELHLALSADGLGQSVSHFGETEAVTDMSDERDRGHEFRTLYFLTYVSIYS